MRSKAQRRGDSGATSKGNTDSGQLPARPAGCAKPPEAELLECQAQAGHTCNGHVVTKVMIHWAVPGTTPGGAGPSASPSTVIVSPDAHPGQMRMGWPQRVELWNMYVLPVLREARPARKGKGGQSFRFGKVSPVPREVGPEGQACAAGRRRVPGKSGPARLSQVQSCYQQHMCLARPTTHSREAFSRRQVAGHHTGTCMGLTADAAVAIVQVVAGEALGDRC